MINCFKKDIGIILLLILVFCLILPFFYMKQGLFLIDTGREYYVPLQMLDGNVLYKDIFNIYAPLSYQINSVIMSIFGQKLNVLYNVGILNSILIVITLFLISREFIGKSISFLFCLMMMFSLVFTTFLYNSNLTYSFGVVYALSAFLLSLLFLIKYVKTEDRKFAYLSCFFEGLSIANKYEFIFYSLVIAYVILFVKPIGIKNVVKSIFAFIFVPLLSFTILLFQGLNINDIKDSIHLINNLMNAPILKMFFNKTGGFFNISYLIPLIINNNFYVMFGFVPILNLCLFINQFKEIINDKAKLVLVLSSIAACAKSFIYLNINHMGIFIFPICALTALVLLLKYSKKYTVILLNLCIIFFAINDFSSLKYKNYTISTPKGTITTYKREVLMIAPGMDFILKETKPEDKVVVLPEGCIINYLTDRKGDNYYYNLSPLFYTDVFTEDRVINHFEQNLPEYFIILPIDNIEYGSSFFTVDYAQKFYDLVVNNYDLKDEINDIKFYKRKNIE